MPYINEQVSMDMIMDKGILTHNSPKYFSEILLERNLKDISVQLRNFKLSKMCKLLNFRFPEG